MALDLNFFIHSVLGPSDFGGYQWYNAPILWGLFLLFYYFLYLFLKKNQIRVDAKLAVSLLPFFILGTIIRGFTDSGLLPYSVNPFESGFYTHSPGLWIGIFFLIIASLLASKKLFEGKRDFVAVFGSFGALLAAIAFYSYLGLGPDFTFVFYSGLIILAAAALVIVLANRLIPRFSGSYLNYFAVFGQLIDGIGTVIITTVRSCGEQHFVSSFVLNNNPLLFPMLKVLLVLSALYLIDRNMENENQKNFVKIVLIALGFMTGPRNILTASLGNCD